MNEDQHCLKVGYLRLRYQLLKERLNHTFLGIPFNFYLLIQMNLQSLNLNFPELEIKVN